MHLTQLWQDRGAELLDEAPLLRSDLMKMNFRGPERRQFAQPLGMGVWIG